MRELYYHQKTNQYHEFKLDFQIESHERTILILQNESASLTKISYPN